MHMLLMHSAQVVAVVMPFGRGPCASLHAELLLASCTVGSACQTLCGAPVLVVTPGA